MSNYIFIVNPNNIQNSGFFGTFVSFSLFFLKMAQMQLPKQLISNLYNSIRKQHLCCAISKPDNNAKLPSNIGAERDTLDTAYFLDKSPLKVNLAMDVFHTEHQKPQTPSCVRKSEIFTACDDVHTHAHLPVLGNLEFRRLSLDLLLGRYATRKARNCTLSIQTLSATGAMRLAADFLMEHNNCDTCLLAQPALPYYAHIFKAAGYKNILAYKYYDAMNCKLNLHGLIGDLMAAPKHAVVVLQACAHNPTGVDPVTDEWQLICHLIKCKHLYALFIIDNQGLATGNVEQDAWPVRHFIDAGVNVCCAQSLSNTFGLYNERIGSLIVSFNDPIGIHNLASKFEDLVRASYGTPPALGSRIISRILGDEYGMRREWLENVKQNSLHLKTMRKALVDRLRDLFVPGNWQHLNQQNGLYSLTGLSEAQIERLIREKHIYLLQSGRINVSGLTNNNVDYVAKSIKDVVVDSNVENDVSSFANTTKTYARSRNTYAI